MASDDAESLESSLAKIRPHTSSSLSHQKVPAVILQALEATLEDDQRSPTAYFAGLTSLLEAAIENDDGGLEEGGRTAAVLYLLSLVFPHVSASVLRAQLGTLLPILLPLYKSADPHAPALRSLLMISGHLLGALDTPQLETNGLRGVWSSILTYGTTDTRPKVRRKATESVELVLASVKAPLRWHPYAAVTLAFIEKSLENTTDETIHVLAFLRPLVAHLPIQSTSSLPPRILTLSAAHSTFLAASALTLLPSLSSNLEADTLIPALLAQKPLAQDKEASTWISVFGALSLADMEPQSDRDKRIQDLFNTLLPYLQSQHTSVQSSTSKSVSSFLMLNSPISSSSLPSFVNTLSSSLTALPYVNAIPHILHIIASLILSSPQTSTAHKPFHDLVPRLAKMRISRGFHHKERVDEIFKAFIQVFGVKELLALIPLGIEPGSKTEPAAYILPLLSSVSSHPTPLSHFTDYFLPLSERMFGYKQTALAKDEDAPQGKGKAAAEAKMWDVLIVQVWDCLAGYVDCRYKLNIDEAKGKDARLGGDLEKSWNKDFAAILSQVLYASAREGGNSGLRSGVLKALRIVVESNRTVISTSLSSLPSPSSPHSIPASEIHLTPALAESNIQHLAAQSHSWLAVLFNVFSSLSSSDRGALGAVVSIWASIAAKSEGGLTRSVKTILERLQAYVTAPQNKNNPGGGALSEAEKTVQTMEDLLLLLIPWIGAVERRGLWDFFLKIVVRDSEFTTESAASGGRGGRGKAGKSKRGWRVLSRLIEEEIRTPDREGEGQDEDMKEEWSPAKGIEMMSGEMDAGEWVVEVLDGIKDLEAGVGATRDRLHLLTLLIPSLPSHATALSLIPLILPEAVLSTKDANERARNEAFELLVLMGQKMHEGGTVRRPAITTANDGMGMNDDVEVEVKATIEEYVTMVAAGLAGATPHMISASLTALGRVMFEFIDDIPQHILTELISTLVVFLKSTNREIIKSTLGCVKIIVHTFPADLVNSQLPLIVHALLPWSRDHKNHFKTRVGHVFERMGRRWGWERVSECLDDKYISGGGGGANKMDVEGEGEIEGVAKEVLEEGRKVVMAIRKRKERAKRKKHAKETGGDDDEEAEAGPSKQKQKGADAFDDVLYGSESESDEADEGEDQEEREERPKKGKGQSSAPAGSSGKKKGRGQDKAARLRMDDDEPMDLLEGVAAHLSGSQKRGRQPGAEASKFKTDSKSGKMIIANESDAGAEVPSSSARIARDPAGDAYLETLVSTDGFTRGPSGKVKFHKDTKKRRLAEAEAGLDDDAVEMGDGTGVNGANRAAKKQKNKDARLGGEFKAKKAGGDLKKGGVDPYAYLPLNQAAKHQKQGHGKKMGVAGKR